VYLEDNSNLIGDTAAARATRDWENSYPTGDCWSIIQLFEDMPVNTQAMSDDLCTFKHSY